MGTESTPNLQVRLEGGQFPSTRKRKALNPNDESSMGSLKRKASPHGSKPKEAFGRLTGGNASPQKNSSQAPTKLGPTVTFTLFWGRVPLK